MRKKVKARTLLENIWLEEFPASPGVKTQGFPCWGAGFDLWLGN